MNIKNFKNMKNRLFQSQFAPPRRLFESDDDIVHDDIVLVSDPNFSRGCSFVFLLTI